MLEGCGEWCRRYTKLGTQPENKGRRRIKKRIEKIPVSDRRRETQTEKGQVKCIIEKIKVRKSRSGKEASFEEQPLKKRSSGLLSQGKECSLLPTMGEKVQKKDRNTISQEPVLP